MRLLIIIISVLMLSLDFSLAKPPIVIPPRNPTDPERLPVGVNKNVLIVGGGLAGLSAALELADRGYNVTIKEKSDRIGGKLFCVPFEAFPNQVFNVEHGFHGNFYFYLKR
jgi:isorenieratene synthase